MKLRLGFSVLCLALAVAALGQQVLTNTNVEKMAKAGLDSSTIVTMIRNEPGHYDLSPDALIALKKDGISDQVIGAMAARNAAPAVAPAPAAENPYAALDIGVYYKANGSWTLLPTEPVNWRTGGVLKNIVTDGIVKGDINGRIHGAASPARINSPIQFLIRTPDGIEATDFQLVHLHQKKNAREFRTVTGGVFHSSGGSRRDAVEFKQTRVARRTYEVTLPNNLQPGEYAFLQPGLTGSSASGSTGRAYTFHFVE